MTITRIEEVDNVIQTIKDHDVIMVGGFGLIGSPLTLIEALINYNAKELTIISNNVGEAGKGLGKLLQQGKIKKAIGSYFTSNREVANWFNEGKLDLELLPQGTFSEAIRAGGAGIAGFYTKTAVGTDLAVKKETKEFGGQTYLLQNALKANIALVKAHKADRLGNLTYYKTARNFNPVMATAADFVIAEADEIVDTGELDSEEIVTSHLYVDAVVKSELVLTKEGVKAVE